MNERAHVQNTWSNSSLEKLNFKTRFVESLHSDCESESVEFVSMFYIWNDYRRGYQIFKQALTETILAT